MPRAKKQQDDEYQVKTLDASRLSLHYKTGPKTGQFAGRFPISFLDAVEGVQAPAKNPNPSITLGNSKGSALIDPYNTKDKQLIQDIMMSDGTAMDAIALLVKFVLGKALQTVTDSRKYFATEELRKQAVESILSNQEYGNVLVQVKQIDHDTKLQERLMGAQFQKYAFGRAALGVVVKDGLPVELKQLSSRNLGIVYADPNWKLLGVEYQDLLMGGSADKPRMLKAEDMLYFTNADYNVTPNSLYYGTSKVKPIIGASVAKRIIIDEDMPETAKSMWAPKYILPVPGVTTSAKMNSLSNALDPGKPNLVNVDVGQPVVFPATDNIDKLMATVHELDRYEIRQIGIPLPFMTGYEDVTNRATMDTIAQQFIESRIEFERTVLQSQLEPQWYDTILKTLTGVEPETLDYRICLEYQNIVLDTFKDKADAVVALKSANLPISDEAYLEMLGMDNLIEDIADVKKQKQQEQQDRMAMMQEQKPSADSSFGNNQGEGQQQQ